MSLIPTWPFVAGGLLLGALGGAAVDHALMSAKVSGLELKIAQIEKAHSDENAQRAEVALSDFQADAKVIHEAALSYATTQSTLGAKMDLIRKDFKNAQAQKPLPVDCRPDAVRVRNLQNAIDAANQATGSAR